MHDNEYVYEDDYEQHEYEAFYDEDRDDFDMFEREQDFDAGVEDYEGEEIAEDAHLEAEYEERYSYGYYTFSETADLY